MSTSWAIVAVALILVAIYLANDIFWTRAGRQMREEFEREFPGRCAYCAFIEYGITHGHENQNAQPKPHHCIENMRRFGS